MAEPMRQSPVQRLLAASALAGALLLTTGCLYRMDIKQGNLLDPTQVVQLQNGMTKSQVRFLLGTPMLPDGFDSDRWNYYYYEKIAKRKPSTVRVTVWFKDDKVERFERPADTEAVAAAMSAGSPTVTPAAPASTPSTPSTPATTKP
jgi:outer membrane protein assembly factor BamE